jgi:hypothetical protein
MSIDIKWKSCVLLIFNAPPLSPTIIILIQIRVVICEFHIFFIILKQNKYIKLNYKDEKIHAPFADTTFADMLQQVYLLLYDRCKSVFKWQMA